MSEPSDSRGETPESELGPDSPTLEDPTPATPDATGFEEGDLAPSVPESADVDPALRAMFWRLVVLYKVAILGGTLGVLLLVFEKGPAIGAELLVLGLGVLGYALYLTRHTKERIDAGEFDDGEAEEP